MSGAKIIAGRLDLMLTELRLPTIKRLAPDLCEQSDREGWPGLRLLEALIEHEIAEREARRIDRHRAESCLQPDKRLSSFYLSRWIKQRGFLTVARAANRVQRMMMDRRIETTIQKRVRLEDAAAGLEQYVEQMSGGKVLICPRKQSA